MKAARKPNSVLLLGCPYLRAAIIHLGCTLPHTSCDLPEGIRRAALKRLPIWSCTGRGLPSFFSHLKNWCALTAPFHPYQPYGWRSVLCCTFLHVTATPRYGASCPMVFGLSSRFLKSCDRLSCFHPIFVLIAI